MPDVSLWFSMELLNRTNGCTGRETFARGGQKLGFELCKTAVVSGSLEKEAFTLDGATQTSQTLWG